MDKIIINTSSYVEVKTISSNAIRVKIEDDNKSQSVWLTKEQAIELSEKLIKQINGN